VGWSRTDCAVVFSVEDTGPGIRATDLPHIFTPLYRAEGSRNRQTFGAGLGLAISRSIVQAHGGDLTATNVPKGGAMFTALLPVTSFDTGGPHSSSATRKASVTI
jgi:signal transduction histidine kinase